VDAATAGPGEVLALGLKSRGATLVGGESFGDTGERKVVHASGGDLWLADRWCVRPDGKPLLGNGLKPDEPVRYRKDVDAVLDRALELARGSAAKQAA
jgi:C-terminal processing protease CtpA/Prc